MRRVSLKYLEWLTDDFSIWQHTEAGEIDRSQGYALDDAARGLIAALSYKRSDLAAIYLNFIEIACCSEKEPVNFYDNQRKPVFERGLSQDALGEVAWALGYALQHEAFAAHRPQIENIIHHLLPLWGTFSFIRSKAYVILGAIYFQEELARQYADDLLEAFEKNHSDDWIWIEDSLTYANAILPLALIAAGRNFEEEKYFRAGAAMLRFLNGRCTHNGRPIAIGNRGWADREGQTALYDQQPIDPAYQVLANAEAYIASGDRYFLEEREKFLSWFWGNNLLGATLIDENDACHDGFDEMAVSPNAGSENIVCYLLAQAVCRDLL